MQKVDFGPAIQMAWVVNDIDAAMRRWIEQQGVGPFYVMRHCAVTNTRYRGRPAGIDMDVAIAQSGGVQVELIQQHDDMPSCYRDMFGRGEEGFHHICYIVDRVADARAHFQRFDMPAAFDGQFGQVEFAYFDTRPSIGCMTEVVTRHPDIEAFFRMIADGAIGWDGRDPIRQV
jgi:Glyoxalase/Bleomycin resistance protein/Dioxygenase superfamily